MRLLKSSLLWVESATLKEETVDIGAIGSFSFLVELGVVLDLVVPADEIDGDGVLPGEVLLQTRQEGLGEEEAGDPEVGRLALVDPLVDEVQAVHEVNDVGSEWLERGVRSLGPERWDPVVKQRVADIF